MIAILNGYVNSIESMGLVDGPGVRVVVFFDRCLLRCSYCHNPEMWTKKEENLISSDAVIEKILKYKTYFNKSGGVTFSGGEPLLQPDFLNILLEECKNQGIHTCLDTCGVGIGNYIDILKKVDLVLFDIKAINPKQYLEITSIENTESLNFLEICQTLKKKMWIRSVIVPTINDNYEYMDELASVINSLENIEKVELLPYHTMAKSKYYNLDIQYKLERIGNMDKVKLRELSKYLHSKLER